MAKQLLGKEVTAALNEKIKARADELRSKGIEPTLGIVRCGEDPSDLAYEKGAVKRAEAVGINVVKHLLPRDVSKEDLLAKIDEINADSSIHGVLMFRPLPEQLKADETEICNHLLAAKDIDCMTSFQCRRFHGQGSGLPALYSPGMHGNTGILRH